MNNDTSDIKSNENNIIQNDNNTKKTILVLSGGGIKGISHIGALQGLEEKKYLSDINTIAGTSVGALIGTLLVVGYTPKDIYDFIMMFDISKMGDLKIENFLNKFGFDDGEKIVIIIKKMFINKGYSENITFKELYDKTNKKLIMTATCINNKKIYYYSTDTYPEMNVIKALRMSISIPIYFTPVEYDNQMYVDGGCIDNYPIELFTDKLDQVIGIYVNDTKECIEKINNLEDTLLNTFKSMMEGISLRLLKGYEKYSIIINLSNISFMNLKLNKQQKQELYNIGYSSSINFISQ